MTAWHVRRAERGDAAALAPPATGSRRGVSEGVGVAPPGTGSRRGLSPRERQVLEGLADGLTGEEVARRLVLSAETVKTHVRNAIRKLDARTRTHAIARAIREGQISGPAPRDDDRPAD